MKRAMLGLAILAASSSSIAQAQQPAPPAQPAPARPLPPADPKLLAAQAAFEALPEAERRAIQQDLGFATSFNGAALGSFGPLTFNAIQTFERDSKLDVDGILSPDERKALAAAAAKARQALRFGMIDDQRSGARIGVPQARFVKREPNTLGGSRWQTADGKATLDSFALPKDGETLQQLFDKATAAQPNRRVTYKLLRPDFFVVTAETQTGKSYRRVTLGPEGALRGFAIGYDKTLAAEMDKLVISVANSFEAFPAAGSTIATPAVAGAIAAAAASRAGSVVPPAAPRERLASGLLLDGGHVLTAEAAIKDCKAVTAGPRRSPARLATVADGLALLRADGLPRAAAFSLGAPVKADQTLTAIGYAWSGAAPSGIYGEAVATGADRIAAPLQSGSAGAALFDGEGALAGLVTDDPGARRQIAGVAPAARYRFAGPDTIGALLLKAGVTAPKSDGGKPTASLAAARKDAVVALICTL